MRLTQAEVAGFAVKMYGGTGEEPFPSDLVREIERAVVEKWRPVKYPPPEDRGGVRGATAWTAGTSWHSGLPC